MARAAPPRRARTPGVVLLGEGSRCRCWSSRIAWLVGSLGALVVALGASGAATAPIRGTDASVGRAAA